MFCSCCSKESTGSGVDHIDPTLTQSNMVEEVIPATSMPGMDVHCKEHVRKQEAEPVAARACSKPEEEVPVVAMAFAEASTADEAEENSVATSSIATSHTGSSATFSARGSKGRSSKLAFTFDGFDFRILHCSSKLRKLLGAPLRGENLGDVLLSDELIKRVQVHLNRLLNAENVSRKLVLDDIVFRCPPQCRSAGSAAAASVFFKATWSLYFSESSDASAELEVAAVLSNLLKTITQHKEE